MKEASNANMPPIKKATSTLSILARDDRLRRDLRELVVQTKGASPRRRRRLIFTES